MRFKLKIDLGNDAMLTYDDLAMALHRVADKLKDHYGVAMGEAEGAVIDENGNSVGRWRFDGGM